MSQYRTVETVGRLGLGLRLESLYRLLLQRTRWTAESLAAMVSLPPAEVEALLAELRTLKLVTDSADDLCAVRAVEPGLALPMLMQRKLESGDVDDVPPAADVEHLIALHESTDTRIVIEPALGSVDQVTIVAERLVARAREEVVMMVAEHMPGAFEFSEHVIEAITRRGVQLRVIWSPAVMAGAGMREYARWLKSQGVRLRIAPSVPQRQLVIDSSAADLPGTDAPFRRGERGVNPQALADGVAAMWAASAELDRITAHQVEDDNVGVRKLHILRLLAQGHTDQTIARRLGVSVRTVRSDVAVTMGCLRATSRFQAGMLAVQMRLI